MDQIEKKTAILYFFSGTGNTARAAEVVGQALSLKDYRVTLVAIGHGSKPMEVVPDLTLVAYPVYAWTVPSIVRKFIKALPCPGGQMGQGGKLGQLDQGAVKAQAAVLATWGGGPGAAVQHGLRLLTKKGYVVTHSGGALYPDNWTHVLNPPDQVQCNKMLEEGEQMMAQYAHHLVDLPSHHYITKKGALGMLPISYAFNILGRRFLGLTYYADSDCTGCGLCEKMCPVDNIKNARGKHPTWGMHCEDCCKCINICPVKAVNSSNNRLYASGILLLLFSMLALVFYGQISSLTPWLYEPLRITLAVLFVHVLWFYATTFITNPLILALEKKFGKKMDASYSKAYRRYKHPNYKG